MQLKKNVGTLDQIIRYGLAAIFLVLGFTVSYFFLIVTVVMVLTAIFKFCGLYRIFGINTCRIDEKK